MAKFGLKSHSTTQGRVRTRNLIFREFGQKFIYGMIFSVIHLRSADFLDFVICAMFMVVAHQGYPQTSNILFIDHYRIETICPNSLLKSESKACLLSPSEFPRHGFLYIYAINECTCAVIFQDVFITMKSIRITIFFFRNEGWIPYVGE